MKPKKQILEHIQHHNLLGVAFRDKVSREITEDDAAMALTTENWQACWREFRDVLGSRILMIIRDNLRSGIENEA